MAVGGVGPRGQLVHIEVALFLTAGGQIAELVAERMGTGAAGAPGGFLRGRDRNFRLAPIHCPGGGEGPLRLQRDLQVGPSQDVGDREQDLMLLTLLPHKTAVGLVGLHGLLQQPHQTTSPNSARPEKLSRALSKIFISISRRDLWRGQSSGRGKVRMPCFITGYQKLAVIFPRVSGE